MQEDMSEAWVEVSETFDLDEAMRQLVAKKVVDQEHAEPDLKHLIDLKKSIVHVAVRQKRAADVTPLGARPVTEEHWDDVKMFLWEMCNIDKMTPEVNDPSRLNLRGTLKMLADPGTKMPAQYQNIAEALYDNFQSENWGEPFIQGEAPEDQLSPGKKVNAENSGRKEFMRARDDHPIFGIHGCMHHVLRRKVKMLSYSIDPDYPKKNPKVFGANGLAVGMCWAMQITALRDGAHGARIGGIFGCPREGAYSIVISGTYDDVDQDRGEEIFYSAAHANTTINKMADKKNSNTQSLLRSVTTKKPVRVLRTAQGRWEGVPKKGIRYDGLYDVTEWHEKQNKKGGTYILFHLIRLNDQAPINRERPSQEEIRAFERVKDGY